MHDINDPRMIGVGVVSAYTMELIGLPVQPIIWGLLGGFVGMGFAKPATFLRAAGVYLAASFISALLGTSISAKWFDALPWVGNTFAALMAVGFHPLLALVIERLPAIFDLFFARGSKREQP